MLGEGVGFEIGRAEFGIPVIKLNIENVGTRVGGILLNTVGATENIAQLIGIIVGEPALGTLVGFELGLAVGIIVGTNVGILVGFALGLEVGIFVGFALGIEVGIFVGILVLGLEVGILVIGLSLGILVDTVGNKVVFGVRDFLRRILLGLDVETESSLAIGIEVGIRLVLTGCCLIIRILGFIV
jgi:hypothetical protein